MRHDMIRKISEFPDERIADTLGKIRDEISGILDRYETEQCALMK